MYVFIPMYWYYIYFPQIWSWIVFFQRKIGFLNNNAIWLDNYFKKILALCEFLFYSANINFTRIQIFIAFFLFILLRDSQQCHHQNRQAILIIGIGFSGEGKKKKFFFFFTQGWLKNCMFK